MKSSFRLVLLAAILFSLFAEQSLRAESVTITFPTLGNCYLCKVRIEDAVNALDGIEDVNWDYTTYVTTATYDDAQLDAFIIMHTIANVGHDTEWFPAPDSAYNLLIGTCCEYERTIDYTNVQVGYLSLMGVWVYPVGVPEADKNVSISVYPTAGTGLFTYDLDSQTPLEEWTITVMSLSGIEVHQIQAVNSHRGTLDLTQLSKGQYILIVSDSRKILARQKLIKL